MSAERVESVPDRGRGLFVVVAGPDGSGKSTVVDALVCGPMADHPVLRMHHRPHVIGRRRSSAPVDRPHAAPARSTPMSVAKLLFLYADYLVGWVLRIRPALASGQHVVLERGWWDLLVDPARYRLHGVGRLTTLLGRLLPRPDVTLVLYADPEAIRARKRELAGAELARQLTAWTELPSRAVRGVRIDTGAALAETVKQVCVRVATRPHLRWIALPRRRSARWTVPAAPRRAARNAFLLYTPVTPLRRLAWRSARIAGGFGAFRLLPKAPPPGEELMSLLASYVPLGSIVSVGKSYFPGRENALVMDARGHVWGLAKVGFDASARRALEQEADAVERLGSFLPPPLAAPRVLVRAPGILVFEAVEWVTRNRPWVLPPPVAHALGRFYRAGRASYGEGPDGEGPAHGDCAPWNVLPTAKGWFLVDWTDARPAAPAFYDAFHFLVQSHALLGKPGRKELVAGLIGHRGWIDAALTAWAAGADVPRDNALSAFPAYVRLSREHLDPTRADGRKGVEAREALQQALTRQRAARPHR